DDPYWTAQYLSEKDRNRTANQTVCSLAELLRLAARTNRSVIFSLRRPPSQHPRHQLWVSDALKVMWTPDWYRKKVRAAVPLLQQTSDEKLPVSELKERGISTLTLHYSQATAAEIRHFSGSNVSVNVYTVNEPCSIRSCGAARSICLL
ncbi:glycerophosphodiester phosphodiesterase domain-containing protein 5-like, partial [Siphateles boraxobius]|uniref:glycerophosphodiester phosphodiesterase domain-containing protein 5-like n=1 Tax=Siphateles boraxobius TaxID=180520 RepID=UPI00406312A2